jgi:hypothetical protein
LIKSLGGGGDKSPGRGRGKDTDDEGELGEGSRVEARYRGGSKYFKGKITRKRLNGTFDILYDDGEKEMGVDKALIKSLGGGGGGGGGGRGKDTDDEVELGEGSRVEARYRGGSKYYKGKITRKRLNGTFDILYDDGEKEEGVDKALIKSLGGGGDKSPGRGRGKDTDDEGEVGEGSRVEARYRGGSKYFKGKITRKRLNGTFDILYDDGEKEMGVDKALIKSLGGGGGGGGGGRGEDTDDEVELGEGSRVEAKYRGGSKYYKGKITRKRLNGTFDILYDDGEKEESVDKALIKSLSGGGDGGMPPRDKSARGLRSTDDVEDEITLKEGSIIEARYKGGTRYYKGKISRKRLNGTFDILYDDGEKEMGVDKNMIKPLNASGGIRRDVEKKTRVGSSFEI